VTCADPECVREESKHQDTNECTGGVREEDMRRVVTDMEVVRWKGLKRKRQLERDPALVYCPVAVRHSPVPATDAQKANLASSEPTAYSTLITCPSWSFSLCDLCQRSWHGLTPCPTFSTPRPLLEHLAYPEALGTRIPSELFPLSRLDLRPSAGLPCTFRCFLAGFTGLVPRIYWYFKYWVCFSILTLPY